MTGVQTVLFRSPLNLANEGKCIAIVPAAETGKAIAALHDHPLGRDAAVIGHTTAEAAGQVGLKTPFGGIRIVEMPLGSLVPRIC